MLKTVIDALHKFSLQLVNRCGEIYVGNVKPASLTQTKMMKSVLDADWTILKTMLDYKCAHAGIVFKEVDESYTTQTFSSCGALPESRPRGGIRHGSAMRVVSRTIAAMLTQPGIYSRSGMAV